MNSERLKTFAICAAFFTFLVLLILGYKFIIRGTFTFDRLWGSLGQAGLITLSMFLGKRKLLAMFNQTQILKSSVELSGLFGMATLLLFGILNIPYRINTGIYFLLNNSSFLPYIFYLVFLGMVFGVIYLLVKINSLILGKYPHLRVTVYEWEAVVLVILYLLINIFSTVENFVVWLGVFGQSEFVPSLQTILPPIIILITIYAIVTIIIFFVSGKKALQQNMDSKTASSPLQPPVQPPPTTQPPGQTPPVTSPPPQTVQ